MDRFARFGGFTVAAVGIAVVAGWIFDLGILKSLLPGLATMKFNTACAFIAAGVSLVLIPLAAPGARRVGGFLSVTVAALGGLTLSEDLFSIDFGIDSLVFAPTVEAVATGQPGRMSPATALSFLFAGLALAGLKSHRFRSLGIRVQWLVILPLFVSTVAIVGYAYDVKSLYTVGPFSSIAAHTAVTLLVLSLAIMAADSEAGIARILAADTAGGAVARRLLPTLPLILFGLGWLGLAGQDAGLYDTHFGLALMVVLSMIVSITAVTFTAVKLHAMDAQRKAVETEIAELNAVLEQRVQERTRDLEESLAQVRQLSGLVPICAWCKKVRDDQDYWHSVEEYVTARTDARFSHGICPDCKARVMASGPRNSLDP